MQDLDLGKTTAMPVRQRVVHGSIPNLLAVCGNFLNRPQLHQTLRVMKCVIICLLAFCIQASAGVYSQSITFSGKNVPLQKVFTAIEKQTNYVFFYNDEILRDAKLVTLNVKNASISLVMTECLKGQPLEFSIEDKTVFVTKKAAKAVVYVEEATPPIDVSGRVTDDQGNPLVGASVKVRGSNKGATTDKEGRFVINDVEENAVLEISFVGHEVQTVNVRGQRVLSISLAQKLSMLDETVVIAYGTTTKRLNTGNVSSVRSDDIAKQPVNNPLLALQGRVSGLFIEQATGLPGSGVKVRVQGQSSLNRGSDPLYVIDGIPYVSQLLPNLNGILGTSGNTVSTIPTGAGNPFSFINPSDIESIEVLKDADATSIYGSRAAAGAILITTKKGKPGKTRVDVNIQKGWGQISRRLDLLDTEQYLEMRREAKGNDKAAIGTTDYDINGTWDTTRYTDWQKELIGKTAKYTNIQTSISGGTPHIQFLIGVGYHKETAVFPGDFNDRKGSLHYNLNNTSANKKFKFTLSGIYLLDENQLPSVDLTTNARSIAPNAPELYNEDRSLNWAQNTSGTTTFFNPLAELTKRYRIETKNLISNVTLSYEIISGLEIKASFGYNTLRSDEVITTPIIYSRPEIRPAFGNLLRNAQYGNNNISSWILEPQLSYKKTIRRCKIELLIGSTFNQINSRGQQLSGSNYNSDLVLEDMKSAGTIKVDNSIRSEYRYNAIFGRVMYVLSDKYIVNVTARRDGSSRFGTENLFNNFGSISGAWIFSNENFVKRLLSFISFGKVRFSYGTTGNDQIGDYQFLNLYNSISTPIPFQGTVGLGPVGLPNPYLQWEETKKTQLGIDLGFLQDKVFLSAGYYHNRSSNQLLSYALPIFTGFNSITENFPATIQNTGWEFNLNTTNVKSKSFNWFSSINFTIAKNKLVSFPDLDKSAYSNNLVIGKPFTLIKVYNFAGVDPSTGIYQFYKNDETISSSPNPLADKTILINTLPEFYGGLQNNFSYKNFELSVFFQFVKQKGQDYFLGSIPAGAYNNNQPVSVLDRWQKPGDDVQIQRYNSNFNLYTALNNALSSNAAWSDASYIRLKNISLSWELPGTWKNKVGFQNIRLYVQGQNLVTITDYKGYDPENRSIGSLPPLRILTLGLRVSL